MRRRILVAISALILAPPALAQPPALDQAAPPAATCTPVAKMFGETICEEELRQGGMALNALDSMPADERQGILDQIKVQNLRTLRNVIWERALAQRFGVAAVQPAPEEIESFRKEFSASVERSYYADKKTAELVDRLLAENKYAPEDEQKLRAVQTAIGMSVKFFEERQKHVMNLPEEYRFIAETAETQVASMMLADWRADKLLYDAYGGALAVDPSGVRPVTGQRALMEYIRKEGKLEIIDPAYKEVPEEMAASFAADPPPLSAEDEALARDYFSAPGWQLSLSNNEERFLDLKKTLEALPVLGKK